MAKKTGIEAIKSTDESEYLRRAKKGSNKIEHEAPQQWESKQFSIQL